MGSELALVISLVCYPGGMRLLPDNPLLRSQPGAIDAAADQGVIYRKQRLELATRGAFVRSYLARDGVDGNGQKLDPVLAWHLGLSEGDKK